MEDATTLTLASARLGAVLVNARVGAGMGGWMQGLAPASVSIGAGAGLG